MIMVGIFSKVVTKNEMLDMIESHFDIEPVPKIFRSSEVL